MPPFTNICKYKDRCPSASGWCFNQQPSEKCIEFLEQHRDLLNQDLAHTNDIILRVKGRCIQKNENRI